MDTQEIIAQEAPVKDPTAGMDTKQLLAYYDKRAQDRTQAMARIIGSATATMGMLYNDLNRFDPRPNEFHPKREQMLHTLAVAAKRMNAEWKEHYGSNLFYETILDHNTGDSQDVEEDLPF
jgi:hypothetical protein